MASRSETTQLLKPGDAFIIYVVEENNDTFDTVVKEEAHRLEGILKGDLVMAVPVRVGVTLEVVRRSLLGDGDEVRVNGTTA